METDKLNETFNQIILKIASGANYASELAKEIGKSTPVIFRQLDELTNLGILNKERRGKKVEYFIQWNFIAEQLANFVGKEFSNAKKIFSPKIPIEKAGELNRIFKSILDIEYIQKIFKKTYQEIEIAGKVSYGYAKTKFKDALMIFLDTFGALSEEQEKKILEKIPKNKEKQFKKFIELSKKYKHMQEEINPRKKILG